MNISVVELAMRLANLINKRVTGNSVTSKKGKKKT
jgi:hypothetical protein